MKRIAFICFGLSLLVVPGRAKEDPAGDAGSGFQSDHPPVLQVNADRYDFGEILSGDVKQKEVLIRNLGGSDLELKGFEFSCGCTIPEVKLSNGETFSLKKFRSRKNVLTLEPGAWASMTVEFTSLGRKGLMTYKMVIRSNDPVRPEVTLPILAEVKPAFGLKPEIVRFGTIQRGQSASRDVVITSLAAGEFEITEFTNLPPFLTYTLERIRESEPCAYRMKLTLDENAPTDLHFLVLKGKVKSEKTRGLAVPVSFSIKPKVSFNHGESKDIKVIDFGFLETGKTVRRKVQIINENPAVPYHIKATRVVSAHADHITLELITVEEGVEYILKVAVKPKTPIPFLRGFIRIESDHPDLKEQKLAIKGISRR